MHVLLADDDAKVRSALRLLVEQEPGMDVVGEATEEDALWKQVTSRTPDLVLLDWELPGHHATGFVSALHSLCPHLRVVALSGRPEARLEAIICGADGFVSKGDPPDRLLSTLHQNCRIEQGCH